MGLAGCVQDAAQFDFCTAVRCRSFWGRCQSAASTCGSFACAMMGPCLPGTEPSAVAMPTCRQCGDVLEPAAAYCPACGASADEEPGESPRRQRPSVPSLAPAGAWTGA